MLSMPRAEISTSFSIFSYINITTFQQNYNIGGNKCKKEGRKIEVVKNLEEELKEYFEEHKIINSDIKMAFAIGYLRNDKKVNKKQSFEIMNDILLKKI